MSKLTQSGTLLTKLTRPRLSPFIKKQKLTQKNFFVEKKSFGRANNFLWYYEESVVDKFKSNLLLMIIWLNIINYDS
jgi:hypothetical protein